MTTDNGYFIGALTDLVDGRNSLTLTELLTMHVPNYVSLHHAVTVVLCFQDWKPCRFKEINGGGVTDTARFTLRMCRWTWLPHIEAV